MEETGNIHKETQGTGNTTKRHREETGNVHKETQGRNGLYREETGNFHKETLARNRLYYTGKKQATPTKKRRDETVNNLGLLHPVNQDNYIRTSTWKHREETAR